MWQGMKNAIQFFPVSVSWIFHEYSSNLSSVMLQTSADPENAKNEYYIHGIKPNILKMFQIVPGVIADLSGKCNENPRIHHYVMLLTVTPLSVGENMKQISQAWNSLTNYFLCCTWHVIKIGWKSVQPLLHNIFYKHWSINRKIDRRSGGLSATSRKCTILLPVSNPILKISCKSVHPLSHSVADRQTK